MVVIVEVAEVRWGFDEVNYGIRVMSDLCCEVSLHWRGKEEGLECGSCVCRYSLYRLYEVVYYGRSMVYLFFFSFSFFFFGEKYVVRIQNLYSMRV